MVVALLHNCYNYYYYVRIANLLIKIDSENDENLFCIFFMDWELYGNPIIDSVLSYNNIIKFSESTNEVMLPRYGLSQIVLTCNSYYIINRMM